MDYYFFDYDGDLFAIDKNGNVLLKLWNKTIFKRVYKFNDFNESYWNNIYFIYPCILKINNYDIYEITYSNEKYEFINILKGNINFFDYWLSSDNIYCINIIYTVETNEENYEGITNNIYYFYTNCLDARENELYTILLPYLSDNLQIKYYKFYYFDIYQKNYKDRNYLMFYKCVSNNDDYLTFISFLTLPGVSFYIKQGTMSVSNIFDVLHINSYIYPYDVHINNEGIFCPIDKKIIRFFWEQSELKNAEIINDVDKFYGILEDTNEFVISCNKHPDDINIDTVSNIKICIVGSKSGLIDNSDISIHLTKNDILCTVNNNLSTLSKIKFLKQKLKFTIMKTYTWQHDNKLFVCGGNKLFVCDGNIIIYLFDKKTIIFDFSEKRDMNFCDDRKFTQNYLINYTSTGSSRSRNIALMSSGYTASSNNKKIYYHRIKDLSDNYCKITKLKLMRTCPKDYLLKIQASEKFFNYIYSNCVKNDNDNYIRIINNEDPLKQLMYALKNTNIWYDIYYLISSSFDKRDLKIITESSGIGANNEIWQHIIDILQNKYFINKNNNLYTYINLNDYCNYQTIDAVHWFLIGKILAQIIIFQKIKLPFKLPILLLIIINNLFLSGNNNNSFGLPKPYFNYADSETDSYSDNNSEKLSDSRCNTDNETYSGSDDDTSIDANDLNEIATPCSGVNNSSGYEIIDLEDNNNKIKNIHKIHNFQIDKITLDYYFEINNPSMYNNIKKVKNVAELNLGLETKEDIMINYLDIDMDNYEVYNLIANGFYKSVKHLILDSMIYELNSPTLDAYFSSEVQFNKIKFISEYNFKCDVVPPYNDNIKSTGTIKSKLDNIFKKANDIQLKTFIRMITGLETFNNFEDITIEVIDKPSKGSKLDYEISVCNHSLILYRCNLNNLENVMNFLLSTKDNDIKN
jgi:hypothetical protein